MANLAPHVFKQYLDDNGDPLSAGYITAKDAGTSNNKATYTTAAGNVAHPAEIPLSSAGRVTFWLEPGTYDFRIYDADDNLIDEELGVPGGSGSGTVSSIRVANRAELKALAAGSADFVEVGGYYEVGDKAGNHTFYWDAAATASDNGGTVATPNSGPGAGRWRELVDGGPLNPYQFGALGDGTDDTTYFQSLLDVTSNIYLPEGNFKITSTLSFTDTDSNRPTGARFGTQIVGAGKTKTYLFCKDITGPLFTHPENTFPDGLSHESTYFADFTITGADDLSVGDEANCSTTFTGIIGNSQSGQMTAGIIAERVRITGIATTTAKAWDLSQMFNVTLRNCIVSQIYNGIAYYGNTANETATTIRFDACYASVCKQGYELINILSVSFINQCIFESCNVVGASFWSNISFYDLYLEDIGGGTGLGVSYRALDPLYDSSTPLLYYANGVSGARAYVNTAFFDAGGSLQFFGGELNQIDSQLAGFYQGVGKGNGSSAGGRAAFYGVRSHMVDRTIFVEDERQGYIYEVHDRQDRVQDSNFCLIRTIEEARKVTHGECFVRDAAGTFAERFEIRNGIFTFGFLPNTTYTTYPAVGTTEYAPYANGDEVILNSGINRGGGSRYRVYQRRNLTTTASATAGATTITIADTNALKATFKVLIALNVGWHYTSVVSVTNGTDFVIADAIPVSRSVANGAVVYSWVWLKTGYSNYMEDVQTFEVSPSFPAGLTLGASDGDLALNNGQDDDISNPAMTITDRRFLNFLNSNGNNADAGFIVTNVNGNLAIGNSGASKFRADPEGLVVGGSADDASITCGTGAPGTGQTFTASSSSGLLLTYATDIPNYHRVRFTTTTTLPTGLSAGTDYWIIKVSDTTCRVATSKANAIAGTAIAYTDAGTGTHTVQLAHKKGSIYSRLDGSSTSTRVYVNTDGAFAWTNFTTAA